MLDKTFLRLKALVGEKAIKSLEKQKVLIFGVGGVGGHVAVALTRSSFLNIDLVDGDVFSFSNINRQIGATTKTIGKKKCLVLKEVIKEINPLCSVETYDFFYSKETKDLIDFSKYTYIVDAVDDLKAKVLIVKKAKQNGVKIISSMGAGNKFNPTGAVVEDIFKTSYCPLARILRKRLKEEGINSLNVVYSKEQPQKIDEDFVGSCYFVPAAFGNLIAFTVFKDCIAQKICDVNV